MSCPERERFIHAYVDGELDLGASIELEEHLATCDACSRTHRELRALRATLKEHTLYYAAPEALKRRIEGSLTAAGRRGGLVPVRWYSSPRILAFAASFAAVALIAWNLGRFSGPPQGDPVADQVFDSHIRSLLANHLTDVPSSDQHTVKPWFNGKTGFSPVVKDFAAEGFPLVGGRLDYIQDVRVAALVYQRRQHVINLFTWASPAGEDQKARSMSRKGYNLVAWQKEGMSYYAVSDVNAAELEEFTRLVQQ